jgi:hypothetical protein
MNLEIGQESLNVATGGQKGAYPNGFLLARVTAIKYIIIVQLIGFLVGIGSVKMLITK